MLKNMKCFLNYRFSINKPYPGRFEREKNIYKNAQKGFHYSKIILQSSLYSSYMTHINITSRS